MTRFIGLDPSTRTGVVILDKHGELIDSMEITAKGEDPGRMMDIIDGVMDQVDPDDFTAIEGFSYGSKGQAVDKQYGIGWGLRMGLYGRDREYVEVAPAALKKFAGGKGNCKKDELAVHIFKRWGFEHKSDNVRDAFVLAHIARLVEISRRAKYGDEIDARNFQLEVISTILNPPAKKKKGA